MTINACRSHCRSLESEIRYAALHGSITCHCSDRILTPKSKSRDRDCNSKCLGNKFEACGANNYLSIYDGKNNMTKDNNYVVCFMHTYCPLIPGNMFSILNGRCPLTTQY